MVRFPQDARWHIRQNRQMFIRDVRWWQPISATSPLDWRTSLGQIAVQVETSDGLIGVGVGGGGVAGGHIIDSVLKPLLIRQEAEPVEDLWNEMYRATLPFGRRGVAIMALSGVDLALWDLRARRESVSVAEWLNSNYASSIPVYKTCWGQIDDALAEETCAIKLHLGLTNWNAPSLPMSVNDVVHSVREAREVIGPERTLMLDAWMQWSVPFTLEVAQLVHEFDIEWIEEPLPPDDLAGYAELSQSSPIPIAGGEHEFTSYGFRPLIEGRLHDVLQPDACWVGGMTEMVKIYAMARKAGLRVVPHRGVEVWGLHALAALDDQPLAESPRPWIDWVRGQPQINAGIVRVDSHPGFGVDLDTK